ncbi:MAG: pirin family protein [Chromatiales bacterium]|jgi:redox-sensitive bicupin YhaK (pirin superfamily)|nr:MAG: pirin family protein [Chromatiales bacterium]
MKKILSTHCVRESHWVGDGFPVRTIFSYHDLGRELSPFLMLDHAGPTSFEPSDTQRGVGWHPHRGFETVTVVIEGEVEHEDSAGNSGRIGPGDVQWMTAGSGVLHKELHGRDYARRGGRFEMLQFWVNLPAKKKMTAPRYQTVLAADIPVVTLPDDAGEVRVIAGDFRNARGPAQTVTPLNLLEVRLRAGRRLPLDLHDSHTAGLFVTKGEILVNDQETVSSGALVVLDREGENALLGVDMDATLFVMSGLPLDEPISGYGPFVMNTAEEIRQAIEDMRNGRLGAIPAATV